MSISKHSYCEKDATKNRQNC